MKKNKSSVLVPSISVDKQKKQRHFREEKSSKNFGQEKFLKQNTQHRAKNDPNFIWQNQITYPRTLFLVHSSQTSELCEPNKLISFSF